MLTASTSPSQPTSSALVAIAQRARVPAAWPAPPSLGRDRPRPSGSLTGRASATGDGDSRTPSRARRRPGAACLGSRRIPARPPRLQITPTMRCPPVTEVVGRPACGAAASTRLAELGGQLPGGEDDCSIGPGRPRALSTESLQALAPSSPSAPVGLPPILGRGCRPDLRRISRPDDATRRRPPVRDRGRDGSGVCPVTPGIACGHSQPRARPGC